MPGSVKANAERKHPPSSLSYVNIDHLLRPRVVPATRRDVDQTMNMLINEIRHSPLLWMLVFVPVVLVVELLAPSAHTLLFVLAILAIVPLAALLSLATESVAEKTGDAVGGLLNATLGNLTELIIALAALQAGEYM